jgi:hypothetical protein
MGTTVYTGTTGSREGFIGPAMRREEKGAEVRSKKAVGARGVNRRGLNTRADRELSEGRGIL